jgi:hypothetical protein
MAGERMLMQHALHQHGETADALAHVDVAQRARCTFTFAGRCRWFRTGVFREGASPSLPDPGGQSAFRAAYSFFTGSHRL